MVMQQSQKTVQMTLAVTPLTSHSLSTSPHYVDAFTVQQWSYNKNSVCTWCLKPSQGDFISLCLQSAPARHHGHSPPMQCNLKVSPLGATICPASDTAPDFLVWCNGDTSHSSTAYTKKRVRNLDRMDETVFVCVRCVKGGGWDGDRHAERNEKLHPSWHL